MTVHRPTLSSWKAFLSRPSLRLASLVFGFLAILAIGTFAYRTEYRAADTRNWVIHSYTIHDKLSELEIELGQARSNAFAYLELQVPSDAKAVRTHTARALEVSAELQQLMADQPRQQERIRAMETLLRNYFAALESCVRPQSCGLPDSPERRAILEDAGNDRDRIHAALAEIRTQEDTLLQRRLAAWDQLYHRNIVIFGLAFAAALLLLLNNFRLQHAEIRKSRELESAQRENAESFRALSARILELQDVERRKIARELHDSVGQYLAALKMNLSQMASGRKRQDVAAFADTIELADRAIAEVRTISHLLHPPLLDELGLQSAASWYVEQFSKRSGIPVQLAFEEITERLPKESELALFRVLQESLTNVYRHTKATRVDVHLSCQNGRVMLVVRDNGQGIPPAVLSRMKAGRAAGIGLAGMSERISDLGGSLLVESHSGGTAIRATLSCEPQAQEPSSESAAVSSSAASSRSA